ncbi:MAG: ABC transporter permease [Paludibacteraceae bacterium]|nr:ABC transporter permease [Paludibacteraceae bacterium]
MDVRFKIAWRYLWGKKSHNAINIVSGVSAAAVMVVTAAMICVLSVMNGFGKVIEGMFSQFDPDLRITAKEGLCFNADDTLFSSLQSMDRILVYSEEVEGTVLVEYNDRQLPAVIKGVDAQFEQLTHIDSIIVDGKYAVREGDYYCTVMGVGLSNLLGVGTHFVSPLHLYAPKRTQHVNMLRPENSFNRNTCYMAGIFEVDQVQYDDRVMLVALPLARQMFDYDEHTVTSIALKIDGQGKDFRRIKKDIQRLLGDGFVVQDRYEQQADFFRILKIEKWLTALLMVFILLIASFNVIGSLTMLILDKKNDIKVLHDLGADNSLIQHIFLLEGWLISSLGALLGTLLGVAVCLLQEHFGLVKLGDGSQYVLSAYPVHVALWDIVMVLVAVLAIGFVAAYYPSRHIHSNEVHS